MTALYEHHHLAAADHEKAGDNLAAARSFLYAAAAGNITPLERAIAYKGAGINFRLARMYHESREAFSDALSFAFQAMTEGDPAAAAEHGTIVCDWGMVHLDEGNPQAALFMFEHALQGHFERGETAEIGRTNGYLGRAYAALGPKYRDKAIECHSRAYSLLLGDKEHRVWWLNNTIWYMKLTGPIERLFVGFRAIKVAHDTGYGRRAREALLLMVGGPKLYDRVRQAHGY